LLDMRFDDMGSDGEVLLGWEVYVSSVVILTVFVNLPYSASSMLDACRVLARRI
jgi:hypothetical protein